MDKSARNARRGDQIRDSIAAWSRQDVPGPFFTITNVTISPDNIRAVVWVSVLEEDKSKEVLKRLNGLSKRYAHRLRSELGQFAVPILTFLPEAASVFDLLGKK